MEELNKEMLPSHIAIIMDGNRRWAKAKKLTTLDGHTAGADNLEKIAIYLNKIGVGYMTVYAFSTENWKRSKDEVAALMMLLRTRLAKMIENKDFDNIRIKVIGEKENVPKDVAEGIEKIVEKTKNNTGLTLNIAFNYGGRAELVHATKEIATLVKEGKLNVEDIKEDTISNMLYTAGEPDPDLMIRTSYELRTSNFLPWQLSYSEFYFTEKHWPDFNEQEMNKALIEYAKRNRRFGGNSK
jgi:undecaprenyl diphosphate synthase